MDTLISNLATTAGRLLLNPLVITVPLLGLLAVATGFAGRAAIVVEDLRSVATARAKDHRPVSQWRSIAHSRKDT